MQQFYYRTLTTRFCVNSLLLACILSSLFALTVRANTPPVYLTFAPQFEGGKSRIELPDHFKEKLRCGQDSVLIYDGPDASARAISAWDCEKAGAVEASFFNESGVLTIAVYADPPLAESLAQAVRRETLPRAIIRNLNPFDFCDGCRDTLAFSHGLAPDAVIQWYVSQNSRTGWRPVPDADEPQFYPPPMSKTQYYRAELLTANAPEFIRSNIVEIAPRIYDAKAENLRAQTNACGPCPGTVVGVTDFETLCKGSCTRLSAMADIYATYRDNFNNGLSNQLWNFTTGAPSMNCPGPNNDSALWFGDAFTRVAETKQFGVSGACSITFKFKFGTEDNGTQLQGCDDAEDPQEHVYFQCESRVRAII